MTLDELIGEAVRLPLVSSDAAAAYEEKRDLLTAHVDRALEENPSVTRLTGGNPLSIMLDNHRNHAQFMANVFRFNAFELLARMIPWVYRSYHLRGFSYDYFPVELQSWIDAVEKHLDPSKSRPIIEIYRWMMRRHEEVIGISSTEPGEEAPDDEDWQRKERLFLSAILYGDHRESLRIAEKIVHTPRDLMHFYIRVIQPAMYRVGRMWETGEISVAQEHLASAVVSRVIAVATPRLAPVGSGKGKAIVTCVTGEFHQIGAWMVADLLELDGWSVDFLGSNTPREDLVNALMSRPTHLLAISVTMPFNLDKFNEIVKSVRRRSSLDRTRVMVGGQLFRFAHDLWKKLGADGYAPDAQAAVQLAGSWWLARAE